MAPPPRRAAAATVTSAGAGAGAAGGVPGSAVAVLRGGRQVVQASLVPQLAHGEELDDPVLDVVQPVVVGVEHLAGGHQVQVVGRRPAPGQVEHPVQPGADPTLLGALRARAIQPVDLLLHCLAHLRRQRELSESGPVVGGGIAVVLAQLLADGGELLAQQVLPLLLLDALRDVRADLLVDLQLGQVVLGPGQDEFHPGPHLGGLQHGEPVVVGHLRPRRDGIRERPGVAGAAQDLRQTTGPTQRGDLFQDHPQLPHERVDARRGTAVGQRLDLLPAAAALADHLGGQRGPLHDAQDRRLGTGRELADLFDLGDDPDAGGATGECGDHDHPTLACSRRSHRGAGLLGVEGQRGDGAGEQHGVGERHDREHDHAGGTRRAGGGRRGVGVSHGARLRPTTVITTLR